MLHMLDTKTLPAIRCCVCGKVLMQGVIVQAVFRKKCKCGIMNIITENGIVAEDKIVPLQDKVGVVK